MKNFGKVLMFSAFLLFFICSCATLQEGKYTVGGEYKKGYIIGESCSQIPEEIRMGYREQSIEGFPYQAFTDSYVPNIRIVVIPPNIEKIETETVLRNVNKRLEGMFVQDFNTIVLMKPVIQVFLHELAHAVYWERERKIEHDIGFCKVLDEIYREYMKTYESKKF